MSSNRNHQVLLRLERDVINAMNRTLTRAKKEQHSHLCKRLNIDKKLLSKRLKPYRARLNDLRIKIKTFNEKISVKDLKYESGSDGSARIMPRHGIVITLKHYKIQKNKTNKKEFFISHKPYKIPGFITKTASEEGIVSSYKTKNGIKESAPRPYTTITHMNAAIVDFTQKDIDVILNKAQEIFNQELSK